MSINQQNTDSRASLSLFFYIIGKFSKIFLVNAYSLLILYWVGIYMDVFEIRKGNVFTSVTRPIYIISISSVCFIEFLSFLALFNVYYLQTRLKIELMEYYYITLLLLSLSCIFISYNVYLYISQKSKQNIRIFTNGIIVTFLIVIFSIFTINNVNNSEIMNKATNWINILFMNFLCLFVMFYVYNDLQPFYKRLFGRFVNFNSSNSAKLSNNSQQAQELSEKKYGNPNSSANDQQTIQSISINEPLSSIPPPSPTPQLDENVLVSTPNVPNNNKELDNDNSTIHIDC
ncbi:hypothetical protein DLAC_09140 [Tieghemostelium lacteum]|uniref:Transmembrane protein n=1 Tax=Tieghemostelium lacteum TaxID=361077 RepID=A0A151Z991_TIELA|nr:hypothetical protein DLAC_09140 [Tieghemostelium lacteum]|eukprot:KYQ90515.1 hypothetical protein DLAC_09140 [Tieghemostelium lacteum]